MTTLHAATLEAALELYVQFCTHMHGLPRVDFETFCEVLLRTLEINPAATEGELLQAAEHESICRQERAMAEVFLA